MQWRCRNGNWLRAELLDLLREHGVGTGAEQLLYHAEPRGDSQAGQSSNGRLSLYVRFLGDRKKMDAYVEERIHRGEQERHWDRLVWDRAPPRQSTGYSRCES